MFEQISSGNSGIDIWRDSLLATPLECCELFSLLSSEESKRAQRYYAEEDRRRFVKRRAVLRKLLSSYIGLPPEKLEIAETPNGKPFLANSPIPLYFNLSHSREIVVYAVSRVTQVGIDIEWIDPGLEIMEIAEDNFCPKEIAHLQSIPGEQRLHLFYQMWTAKEAFLKCIGCGLAIRPKQVKLEFDVVSPNFITNAYCPDYLEGEAWCISEFFSVPQYVSMVAFQI